MDLKKSSITADILNILSDSKIHSMQEIADEVEVSYKTINRHIQSLSYRYPIQTFRGGKNYGGVILDKNYIHQGKILSIEELQLINKALVLLQKTESEVDSELLSNLINNFALPNSKNIYKQ